MYESLSHSLLGLSLTRLIFHFSHDPLNPFGQIESRAGSKTQQCICQGHWNEDAGIENSREGCCHSSWPPSGNLFFSYKPVSKACRDNRLRAACLSCSRLCANCKTSRK